MSWHLKVTLKKTFGKKTHVHFQVIICHSLCFDVIRCLVFWSPDRRICVEHKYIKGSAFVWLLYDHKNSFLIRFYWKKCCFKNINVIEGMLYFLACQTDWIWPPQTSLCSVGAFRKWLGFIGHKQENVSASTIGKNSSP